MSNLSVSKIVSHIKAFAVNNAVASADDEYFFLFALGKERVPFVVNIKEYNISGKHYISLTYKNLKIGSSDIIFRDAKSSFKAQLSERIINDGLYISDEVWSYERDYTTSFTIREKFITTHRTTKQILADAKNLRNALTSELWDYLDGSTICHDVADYETIQIDWDNNILEFIKKGYTYHVNDLSIDELAKIVRELNKETIYTFQGEDFKYLADARKEVQKESMEYCTNGEDTTLYWQDDYTLIINKGTDYEKVLAITKKEILP